MKYFLVVFFAVFLSIEAQQTDREQENIRANLRNDFQPKHYDCKRKFNDLAYLTGRNFHPVIQSLTQQWDRTKIRVIELFNPLPCGNCKEIARKIENDLNFNIAAFREEYTIDRLHQRLREGFRDGYERFLLPASNYMDEFKPYKEQLKNVMTCWSTTRKNIFKIFDDAYLDALKNISKAIHGFENEYKNIGESFDQGVINATKEAAKCTSYKQGFGYCEFLYVSSCLSFESHFVQLIFDLSSVR